MEEINASSKINGVDAPRQDNRKDFLIIDHGIPGRPPTFGINLTTALRYFQGNLWMENLRLRINANKAITDCAKATQEQDQSTHVPQMNSNELGYKTRYVMKWLTDVKADENIAKDTELAVSEQSSVTRDEHNQTAAAAADVSGTNDSLLQSKGLNTEVRKKHEKHLGYYDKVCIS